MLNILPHTLSKPNVFQRYLIPFDSKKVCYLVDKAKDFGCSRNFFYAHFISIALTITAIVFSFFNAISYLLQAPVRILLNVIRLDPLNLLRNFLEDIIDVIRSLFFVSLGISLVVSGFLFPKTIFPYFAPNCNEEEYKDALKKQIYQLENSEKKASEACAVANEIISDLLNENQRLEKELKNKKTWRFWK